MNPIFAVVLPLVGGVIILAGVAKFQHEHLMVDGASSSVKAALREHWFTIALEVFTLLST